MLDKSYILKRVELIDNSIPKDYQISESIVLDWIDDAWKILKFDSDLIGHFLIHSYYIEAYSYWADMKYQHKKRALIAFENLQKRIKETLATEGKFVLPENYLLLDFIECYNAHHKNIYFIKLAFEYFNISLAESKKLVGELCSKNITYGSKLRYKDISPFADTRKTISIKEYSHKNFSLFDKMPVPPIPNGFI